MESWKIMTVLCGVFFIGYCDDLQEQKMMIQQFSAMAEAYMPILTNFEDKCRQKGQAELEEIHAGVANLTSCVAPLISEPNPIYKSSFPRTITDLTNRTVIQSAIRIACGDLSAVRKCLRPLVDVTLECLTPTEGENLNSIWNAVSAGINYFCSHKGARYIELLKTNGTKTNTMTGNEDVNNCENEISHLAVHKKNILGFNHEYCKALFDLKSCAVTDLKQYPDSRTAEIVEELFAVVLSKLPCDFQSCNAAPSTVVPSELPFDFHFVGGVVATLTSDLIQFLVQEDQECILSARSLPQCFNNLNWKPAEKISVSDKLICKNILGMMPNLRTCVVKTLEKCTNSTSSHIADSVASAILKVASCEELEMKNRDSATTDLGPESVSETGTESASSHTLDTFPPLAHVLSSSNVQEPVWDRSAVLKRKVIRDHRNP